jgi:HK97 family phage prohead protease
MIRFSADPTLITAQAGDATEPARISGLAVPWDTVATVSDGTAVRFARGAFDVSQKPAKLIENHDISQLRGIVNTLTDSPAGLEFEATLADTRASRDAVALLKAGAYDSVSVGAHPTTFTTDPEGVMTVTAATLIELSLVAVPAFREAVITNVAANAADPDPEPETDKEQEMTDAAQAEPIAAEATTIPTNPIIYAEAKRAFVMPTPAEYICAFAAGGSAFDAMQEGIRAAAPDVLTTDTPGILPVPIIQPTYNNFVGSRPVVDAVGARAMPAGGKVFIRPKVTTHTSIGVQSTENTQITEGTFVVDDIQVTKGTYGGTVSASEQVIDFTVPEVIGLILDDMGRIYANQTDNVAADALVAGATTDEAFVGSITDPAAWALWVSTAAQVILSASNGNLPTHLFVSPDRWGNLLGLSDTSDRPLFPNIGPMNAFGDLSVTSDMGMAFGLRVVVDRNFAASTTIIGDASGFECYEQQKGAISVDVPSTLSRTIAFRGYFSALMLDSSKFVAAS